MHKGLYDALTQALKTAQGYALANRDHRPLQQSESGGVLQPVNKATMTLSGEGLLVGQHLKDDFDRHGVHLAPEQQRKLAHLTARALQLGISFGGLPSVPIHHTPTNVATGCLSVVFSCLGVMGFVQD